MSSLRAVMGLLVALVVVFAAAAIGGAATSSSVGDWYQGLRKPPFSPPSWVFGPVWTALYGSMAVAAWLVWRRHGFAGAPLALALFGLQLALNLGWSVLFFGLRSPGLALGEIIVLWVTILATLLAFRPLSPLGALLLAPYLAWVTFAAVLNHSVWALNRL